MKAIALLFSRVATGSILVLWGLIKIAAPSSAIHVSDKFYHGLLSAHVAQAPLGVAEIALGLMVVVGLARKITLPIQALVLGIGLIAIWRFVLDPLGLYLVAPDAREPLFFPSIVVFGASCMLIAFREFDRFALDRAISRGDSSP